MGEIKKTSPVQLFCGLIFAPRTPLEDIKSKLKNSFGAIDYESDVISFNFTDYYTPEMGDRLNRVFYAFENLIQPDEIAAIKIKTNEMEKLYLHEDAKGRRANIDPGYITLAKMVLATTKDYNHRIYLRDGVFAETTLNFRKPTFEPYPWTYPDYKTPEYIVFFNKLRELYKKKLSGLGRIDRSAQALF